MKRVIDGEADINRKFMETVKLINVYCNHFPKHEIIHYMEDYYG